MSPPRYRPGFYPPRSFDWPTLLPLIGRAQRAIAGYEGVLHGVPNPDVLLSPLSVQEAVLSSRIEGTQSSLSEVLALGANGDGRDESPQTGADAREVPQLPRRTHGGDRVDGEPSALPAGDPSGPRGPDEGNWGQTADPGDYRRIQNWIGPPGSKEETATLVTCPVPEIPDAMGAWERYLHEETPDALVQLGVAHVWFEAIHPFLDGNGRLGA